MNIGRSEYTRLVRQEVRLKKAEKLLEECVQEFKEIAIELETERGTGKSLNEIMERDEYYPKKIKNIQKFLEEK